MTKKINSIQGSILKSYDTQACSKESYSLSNHNVYDNVFHNFFVQCVTVTFIVMLIRAPCRREMDCFLKQFIVWQPTKLEVNFVTVGLCVAKTARRFSDCCIGYKSCLLKVQGLVLMLLCYLNIKENLLHY